MRILDASYEALREFVEADDRAGTELLLDEILRVELARRQRQLEDAAARRYNSRPSPWIPVQHIRF